MNVYIMLKCLEGQNIVLFKMTCIHYYYYYLTLWSRIQLHVLCTLAQTDLD